MEQEKKKKSRVFKGIGIGCGSLLGVFIILIVLAVIFGSGDPIFDNIKSPTNQSSITLSASNAYKNANVEFYQDGIKTQDIKSDSKGKFTVQVVLKEGDNKFKATSTSEKGKTKTGKEINVIYDKIPPILVLAQTKIETDSDKAEISGETENNSTITLFTNEKEIGKTTAKDSKFKFSVKELKNGENKFIIKVIDEAGNIGEQKEVVITYTPKSEPAVTTSTPTPTQALTTVPAPVPTSTQKFPRLSEETMDKDLYLSCAGGDEVVLWTEPTDYAGGAVLHDKVPCGTLSWAFNKYNNEALGVTFYAVNTAVGKSAWGWVTEDLITWK